MNRVLLRVAGALIVLAAAPATTLAAPGWSDPVRISSPPAAQGDTVATDQAADGAGNVHVAYQQCGEPMGAFASGCSLQLVTRSATTGDWAAPVTVAPTVGFVDGPAAIDVEANAAGDVVVGWETCGYGSNECVLQVAMRPRGNDAWTPATAVVPEDLTGTHTNDWNFAPDVALGADGAITVAWNRGHRHESSSVSTIEVLARTGAVADPGVEHPVLVFAPEETIAPASGAYDRADAPVIVTADDGTTVAAWWYQGGGACHLIRYAVRPAGGAWAPQQTLGGPDCATALTFMTPEYALAAVGNEAVLVYSAALIDETGATTGDAGTWATTIDAAGAAGPSVRLSDRLFGLAADPTTEGDLTRAQFDRNAAGELVLAANDQDESGDRPVVAVRAADGEWGPVVFADGPTPTNGGLGNPAPGVAIDGAGTVTLAWSINVAVATPEDPWASDQAVRTAQLPRGAIAFGQTVRLSEAGKTATRPLVSRAPGGLPIVSWRQSSPENTQTALHATEPSSGPQASFTWAPTVPVAGQTVTFTSTSTDPDGPITAWSWDLNDDGVFDDRTGATAQAIFDAAGDYTVTLRVTDGDEQIDYAVNVVVVERGSDPDPGAGPNPGHDPGGDPSPGSPPAGPAPAPMTIPPPYPSGFIQTSAVNTVATRPMPAVAGRSLDDARGLVLRSLVHADITTEKRTADSAKLGKRPGGGKWKLGDIVAQSPAAGSRHEGSVVRPTAVKLTYWAGAKSDKDKCDELRRTIKGDDLDLALAQLKAAKCGTPDLKLKASKKADDPTVKSLSKDHDDLTVNVPTDQSKLDIVIWKNTGFLGTNDPGPVPSANGDLQLTAGQQNVAGVILRDRAGHALSRASVTWDLTGVGGSEKTTKSIESGVAPVKLTPEKAGTVRVLVSWSDKSGETIYGYTEFKVIDRAKEPGFVTAIGQSFKRSGSGKGAVFKPGSFKGGKAQRAGVGDFFTVLAQVIRGWGGPIAGAVNATAEGILGVAKTFGTSVAQLWRGPVNGPPTAASASFTNSGIWMVQPNGVVAAGGANVVAAGGMNVIAAGGGNVVAAGGMNVIAAGGGNVVAAGGGNIISLPDGARVVAAGGGNVVAAGGMNVIAAGGGN